MNKRFIFVLFVSFFILFLSYFPDIYEASLSDKLPNDRIMITGEHIYTYDYNVYLSKIRQGQEGKWNIVDKYDNNNRQQGVFLQMVYLLSGKISGILHLSPVFSYHLLRIITSIIWILLIVFINYYLFKSSSFFIWGSFLCLLASSFPIISQMDNQFWIRRYMEWWQEMDVLKRISFIPHDMINYIVVTILTVLIIKFFQTWSKKIIIMICVVLFFSSFIHPVAGILFIGSWIFYFLIRLLYGHFSLNKIKSIFLYTLLFGLIIIIPLIYIKAITSSYPWKALTDFDQYNRMPFSIREYIMALGPIFFTGLLGIILVIKQKNTIFLAFAVWLLAAFSGMLIFKFFPYQSPMRFIQTANHIPLAILTVYGLKTIQEKYCQHFLSKISQIILIIIISLGIIHVYFSLKGQMMFIHQRAMATLPLVPYPSQVMYPLKDFYYGIKWLENNTSRSSVVLSKITAGNYIPAYSGNFVYLGHSGETPHFWQRNEMVNQFFTGTMSDKDAYDLLKQANINYIFYGPQEREASIQTIDRYKFLKPVYQSYYVIIYKIQ